MLVDANLLVYAVDEDDPHHRGALEWLVRVLNGNERVGLAWESLTAFLRLVTNPRVKSRPMAPADAWGYVRDWLDAELVWTPLPTERHAAILGDLVSTFGLRANLIPDGHLAAIAIGHGLTVYSADSDFARFAGKVDWRNPLAF